MQYNQHASVDTLTPSLPSDTSLGASSDDSVDIDMEKLKAEAKEVACSNAFTSVNSDLYLCDLTAVI